MTEAGSSLPPPKQWQLSENETSLVSLIVIPNMDHQYNSLVKTSIYLVLAHLSFDDQFQSLLTVFQVLMFHCFLHTFHRRDNFSFVTNSFDMDSSFIIMSVGGFS